VNFLRNLFDFFRNFDEVSEVLEGYIAEDDREYHPSEASFAKS